MNKESKKTLQIMLLDSFEVPLHAIQNISCHMLDKRLMNAMDWRGWIYNNVNKEFHSINTELSKFFQFLAFQNQFIAYADEFDELQSDQEFRELFESLDLSVNRLETSYKKQFGEPKDKKQIIKICESLGFVEM